MGAQSEGAKSIEQIQFMQDHVSLVLSDRSIGPSASLLASSLFAHLDPAIEVIGPRV